MSSPPPSEEQENIKKLRSVSKVKVLFISVIIIDVSYYSIRYANKCMRSTMANAICHSENLKEDLY